MRTGYKEHVHKRINANGQLNWKKKKKPALSSFQKRIHTHTLNFLNSQCWQGFGIVMFFFWGAQNGTNSVEGNLTRHVKSLKNKIVHLLWPNKLISKNFS